MRKYLLISVGLLLLIEQGFPQKSETILDENIISFEDFIQSDRLQLKIAEHFIDKKVFFIAETHGLAINTEYQLFFLKYFHKYADVRNLITEYSYGTSLLIDKYLNTGDTVFLQGVPANKNSLYRAYWAEIHNWNRNLPEDQRISVYGIGRFNWPIIAPLYHCIPKDKAVPEELKSEINTILQLYKSNHPPSYYGDRFEKKENQKLRKTLKKKLQKYPDLKSYFGSDYIHVKHIVSNHAAYKPTDDSMFKNFNELQDILKGNMMIVFGSYHCFIDRWEHKYDPLAKLINESEQFRNQVYTTIGYFDNCSTSRGITVYDDGLKPFVDPGYNQKLLNAAFEGSDFSILNLDMLPKEILLNKRRYADLFFMMRDQKPVF